MLNLASVKLSYHQIGLNLKYTIRRYRRCIELNELARQTQSNFPIDEVTLNRLLDNTISKLV